MIGCPHHPLDSWRSVGETETETESGTGTHPAPLLVAYMVYGVGYTLR